MLTERYILIGGPRTGKSTYASRLRDLGYGVVCADPINRAKDVIPGVEYLPAELGDPQAWSLASEYIATVLMARPGPWVLEGVAMARALRKWLPLHPGELPAEHVVVFAEAMAPQSEGQRRMSVGVASVFAQVSGRLRPVLESPCRILMGGSDCPCLRGLPHSLRPSPAVVGTAGTGRHSSQ